MAMATMTWAEVTARRIERHGLANPVKPAQIPELVRAMCGVHAQVITAAELSLGIRLADASRATVQEAIWQDRALVKTYGARGTVHLLPSQDLPMWTGALSAMPSVVKLDTYLTPEQTDQIIAALDDILQEEADLTTDELTDALVAKVGSWAGDLVMEAFQGKWARWRWAISTAANRGVICFGENRGRSVTFTHPRRWMPDFKPMEGQAALRELVKHYLYGYGPAASAHFARWLSVSPRRATDLFESMRDELEQVEVDGDPAWVVKGDTDVPSAPPSGVRLLPYFDAYVVGAHPREKVFPGRASERALARTQAGNFPVLLIDGLVAGVWHQKRSGKKIAVTVEPLDSLTAAQKRELDDQVARIGEFFDGTAQLTIGKVSVGAHA
jgi:hypothetical protein